ncbi:transposase family protein [Streptomyces sp. NPDC056987]|uniref:helix-turn-helix domain-containing protein n=1 Tax=Streptomyces sp. NPDC056987 TaxID=3345988 RepID=UPI00363A7DB8
MARAAPGRADRASASQGVECRAKRKLVFIDRLLATLVHPRHGVTHGVLAGWFGVDRSTMTRAIGEVRPLPAERGCTVAPDVRLRYGSSRRPARRSPRSPRIWGSTRPVK